MASNTTEETKSKTSSTDDLEPISVNGEQPPQTNIADTESLQKNVDEGNDNEDEDVSSKEDVLDWDDFIDEVALKDKELTYTEEERKHCKAEAEEMKEKGNQQFREGEFRESAITYTLALRTCPISYPIDRSKLYSNRAASKMKLGLSKSAIEDCNQAVELNPGFVRALWRRAQLFESTDKLDEALEDCKKILEIDPAHTEANFAIRRLPDLISERNEKLKTEMMSKLKDLGNLFLRPFGLSTDNFQVNQDPNSGGYSINFKQS